MDPAALQCISISITEALLPVKVTHATLFLFSDQFPEGKENAAAARIYNAHRWRLESVNNKRTQDGMPYGPTPWGICHWPGRSLTLNESTQQIPPTAFKSVLTPIRMYE